jgi:hypothetical protein
MSSLAASRLASCLTRARVRALRSISIAAAVIGFAAIAVADEPAQPDAGKKAFLDVARVLQSPRCMNCHPSGDAPLQTDRSKPHAMNITRASVEAGVACGTCHQEKNSEAVGVRGGPPGAPHWGLPPKETPLVFQGLTPTQLCEQLKDPARNGKRDAAALLEHVEHDPLVLWGWDPGGKRSVPPISHEAFVAAWKTWTAANRVCP